MTGIMSKGKKAGDILSVRLDPELASALEAFRADQRIRPDKTAVMTTALREFLEREGYLPKDGGK